MQELLKRQVIKPKGSGSGGAEIDVEVPEVSDLLEEIDSMISGSRKNKQAIKRAQKERRSCGC